MTTSTKPQWSNLAGEIIHLASRAPSIHNTQPWRWRVRQNGLDLRPDTTRWLPATDPGRHGLVLSCGATLRLAEIAARSLGLQTRTHWQPAGEDGPLARLTIVGEATPAERDLALAAAGERRRSYRGPLDGSSITMAVERRLEQEVGSGISITRLRHSHRIIQAAVLANAAETTEWADRRYRDELREWTHADDDRPDGIPRSAIAETTPNSAIPQRDFGIRPQRVAGEDAAAYFVLGTSGDFLRNWLAAGSGAMQLMLNAELEGLASCPLTQPVDSPAFRCRLGLYLGGVDTPQFILRVGRPGEPNPTRRTPRRATDDIIDL